MEKVKSDLWIIGDSFTERDSNKNYWVDILMESFLGENIFINSCPGRDVQTIMDLFYKNLHNIKDESLVIIFLPSICRLRYPKSKKYFKTFVESGIHKEINDNIRHNFDELFIHFPYTDYENKKLHEQLNFPFNTLDYSKLDGSLINYEYNNQRERLGEVNNNISQIDFAKLLLANEAISKNWSDIFYSLKKAFKFKILFYSWTDEYDTESVFTKKVLTNLIGYWHTLHDEHRETNGKSGIWADEHFSLKMHKSFADFIIKMNSSYFK